MMIVGKYQGWSGAAGWGLKEAFLTAGTNRRQRNYA